MSDQKFFQILSWYLPLPHLLSFSHLETFNLELHINLVAKRMTLNLDPTSGSDNIQKYYIKSVGCDIQRILDSHIVHVINWRSFGSVTLAYSLY